MKTIKIKLILLLVSAGLLAGSLCFGSMNGKVNRLGEFSLGDLANIAFAQDEGEDEDEDVWEWPGDDAPESDPKIRCDIRVLHETAIFHMGCGCYQPYYHCTCGPGFC